jgi:pyruvate/2-oxoglutarate dehydrogenase complex dihydrolipoamide dehydrogenase (E3) component
MLHALATGATSDPTPGADAFDLIIIGGGSAGEAAAHLATGRGARVAIVDRELFGGSCPFWACMPSKALLHAAAVHVGGGSYDWRRASDFRDWMINREQIDWPDDTSHVRSLESAGACVLRGTGRFEAPGIVAVDGPEGTRRLAAPAVIVAVGSQPRVPNIPGLEEAGYWTNREGTTTRELPRSLAIMGAGPTGVELAQVYARFGVPVTLIHKYERILHREHPRSSQVLAEALEADGVSLRRGPVREVLPSGGADGAHRLLLADGSSVEAQQILVATGRRVPLDELNLAAIGVTDADLEAAQQSLRLADGVYLVGDALDAEMHTHVAHYDGEAAARMAMGDAFSPDLTAIPRGVYTEPEIASVGLQVDEARDRGIDAVEHSLDLARTAKGYVLEAKGHVSIVVDRARRTLVGAFIAGPGAAEAIHEAVLAMKTGTTIDVLADTIHAFPTTARVLGTAFIQAAREGR